MRQLIAFNRGKLLLPLEKNQTDLTLKRAVIGDFIESFKLYGFELSKELLYNLEDFPLADLNEIRYYVIGKLASEHRNTSRQVTTDLVTIESLSFEDFMKIPLRIMTSGNSITKETKEELEWFLDNYIQLEIPKQIPFKETLCIVLKHRPDFEYISSINDYLRFGVYLLGGDPMLPRIKRTLKTWMRGKTTVNNPSWKALKKPKRSERRLICGMIESFLIKKIENPNVVEPNLSKIISDAKRFKSHWKYLSELIHPGDFNKIFPNCSDFFMLLKTNGLFLKECRTWNSEVQAMYDNNTNILEIAKFISKRPGELIRRFDSILRKCIKQDPSLNLAFKFFEIFADTEGMNNKTLFELLNYYEKRSKSFQRVIKTKSGETYVIEKPLEPLADSILRHIKSVLQEKIITNIKSRAKLSTIDLTGQSIYLDPEIARIPIPKDMRHQAFIPGIREKLPNSDVIRFFVHWIQGHKRNEDIDLHAYYYKSSTEKFNIGWNTGLDLEDLGVHSGDIIDTLGDCTEYVDINIPKSIDAGYKYVLLDIMNYKDRPLSTLPVWHGYTAREKMSVEGDRNLNWVPEGNIKEWKLNSTSVTCASLLIDLVEREIIVVDRDLNMLPVGRTSNNVLDALIEQFSIVPTGLTVFKVLETYYSALGATIVNTIEKDTIVINNKELSLDYTKITEAIGK